MAALGIDYKLIIGQIVNFLILLVILRVFLYKPIVKMLDERRQKIAESVASSKKIEQNLAQTEIKTRQILEEARTKASKIIDEAGKISKAEKDKIILSSQIQAEGIIQSAKDEARRIQAQITIEAKKEIGKIVIIALNKIVNDELSESQTKELVARAIKKI